MSYKIPKWAYDLWLEDERIPLMGDILDGDEYMNLRQDEEDNVISQLVARFKGWA